MKKTLLFMTLAVLGLAAGAVDYDLNGDGVVDRLDYNLLAARIASTTAGYDSRYDLDGNGSIDAHDANLMLDNYGGTATYTVNGVSFKMVAVEGGTFFMGATAIDVRLGRAASDEYPGHLVTISSYSIGQTEVTQELWQAVMGSNPSDITGNLQRPVERVSWDDCQTFIARLNDLTGKTFRLPTEAEWEYAARSGNRMDDYKYAGSNNLGDVAWYWENSYALGSSNPDYGTHTVATKSPNELGLYDMSGNVYEWCQDWYGSYSSDAQTDPTGPTSGDYRVLRGGGWSSDAYYCRVLSRYSGSASSSNAWDRGFRLAL